jgi:hypothetical protein
MTDKKQKISETEILQGMIALQTKIDALGQQVFNGSLLLEFVIEKIQNGVASRNIEDMTIDMANFQDFYKQRFEEIQAEWQEHMQKQIGIKGVGTTDAGAGPMIDLNV